MRTRSQAREEESPDVAEEEGTPSEPSPASIRKNESPTTSSCPKGTNIKPTIRTIGHGTRTLSELIDLLQSADVVKLVDARSFPRSIKNPQFNQDKLESSPELEEAHISYTWLGDEIGGRRNAQNPTVEQHTAIRVAAFRNYAGYMTTKAFRKGLEKLKDMARKAQLDGGGHAAIMCSETLWWRCHRRMIADALVVDGYRVRHLGVGKTSPNHELWDIARVDDDGNIIYDVGS